MRNRSYFLFGTILGLLVLSAGCSNKKISTEDSKIIRTEVETTKYIQAEKISESYKLIRPDDTFCSSSLDAYKVDHYISTKAVDEDITTAWCEGDEGDGIGEWIELQWDNDIKLHRVEIDNGYGKSEDLFMKNNRIKNLTMIFSDDEEHKETLSDGFSSENNIELHEPVETSSIRFRIDSVYKGSNYSDTCVSEIRVYGTSSGEEEEAEETSITDKELGLINISLIDDTLVQDIKYATEENFTGSIIYETSECSLNIDAAKALSEANKELRTHGFTIKIWDGYRSKEAQEVLWNKVPDRRYVAPPWKGSVHNKGRAVDITLISNKTGKEVEMPTEFDDFSEKAWRSAEKSERAEGNLNLLTDVMKKYGYETIETEWWHFNYRGKH